MLERLNGEIEFQKEKLARKERLLEEYLDMLSRDEKLTEVQYAKKEVLLAEKSLLKLFIESLKHIKEP